MNEKITKKAGEAYAFAQVLEATCTDNEVVMKELFDGKVAGLIKTASQQQTALKSICDEAGTVSILLPKAEKTAAKITSMGELYVGDQWTDAAEVLEWMSFFVGGAIVHWQLISGAGEEMGHVSLKRIADAGVVFYSELQDELKLAANGVGAKRSR